MSIPTDIYEAYSTFNRVAQDDTLSDQERKTIGREIINALPGYNACPKDAGAETRSILRGHMQTQLENMEKPSDGRGRTSETKSYSVSTAKRKTQKGTKGTGVRSQKKSQ